MIPEEEGPPESEPWTVTSYINTANHASIIRLTIEDPYGVEHIIGVDRRPALAIIAALEAGDVVLIQPPEPWQLLG